MTLIAVERPGRRTEIDKDGKLTGRRTFIVESTTRLNGFETVTNLPARGDLWPSATTLWAQSVTATESEQLSGGGWLWTIEVEYSNFFEEEDGSNLTADPLDRTAVWTWDSENFTETRFEDLDGSPYVNVLGEPFSDPPTFDVAHVIATVKKNYSSFDGGFALTYVNTVNSASFGGGARGTVKIDRISCQPRQQDGVTYYETTLTLHYNPDGWNPRKVLNEGTKYRQQVGGTWKWLFPTDSNGVPSNDSVLLLADGTRCNPGQYDFGTGANQTPYYIEFRQYDYQDFSVLNLT